MNGTKKLRLPEWLTAGVAFIYYCMMALYKLTQTPIWQDEAMEFYCSIPVRGAIRGVTEYQTMYERMAYIQQQPPLYNWVMCLWLQISEGEWWYRFSSVVFGFFAAAGLYAVIKKLCSSLTAAVSVIVFSSVYILMYYIKEASEYSLLIMFLFWTLYLYLRLLEQSTIKGVLLFTLLCVVNIYTHYGAVFVVVPLALSLLCNYAAKKDWRLFWTAFVSDAVAALGAGIPLVLLFLIPQSSNAVSTLGVDKPIEITGNNLILDFFDSMMWVLRWCMLDYDRDWERLTPAIWVLLFVILSAGVFVWIHTKKREVRYLFGFSIGMYFLYYVVTTLNIYAYGWFGNRYNLFIFPIWFVLIAVIVWECLNAFRKSSIDIVKKAAPVVTAVTMAGILLFCCYGVKRIRDHWDKMDLRTVVSVWYEHEGEETETFVNFHQRYPFVYYLTHNDQYSESCWDTIHANQNLDSLDYSDEEWIAYLKDAVYADALPQKLYVVSGQKDTIVEALETYGYHVEPVVDSTAKLFLLTAPE